MTNLPLNTLLALVLVLGAIALFLIGVSLTVHVVVRLVKPRPADVMEDLNYAVDSLSLQVIALGIVVAGGVLLALSKAIR